MWFMFCIMVIVNILKNSVMVVMVKIFMGLFISLFLKIVEGLEV